MNLSDRYHQLPASLKLCFPLIGISVGLWLVKTLSFTGFTYNALEQSAKQQTNDLAAFLERTIETEQRLLQAQVEIIGDSALLDDLANNTNIYSTQNLLILNQSRDLDFVQVFNSNNGQKVVITADYRPLHQDFFTPQEIISPSNTTTGFFLSQNKQEVYILATTRIEFPNKAPTYITIGKSLDRLRLSNFKEKTDIHLLLLNEDNVLAGTVGEKVRKIPGFSTSIQETFWKTIDHQDYLIKPITFTTLNEANITIALLSPTEATEKAEASLLILIIALSTLGIITLYIVMTYFLKSVRAVNYRVKVLSDATETLAQGDSCLLLDTQPDDDLGRLTRNFTVMAKKLYEREQELQEKVVLLEKALQDLNRSQNQIIQSEKMSALGQMVAGIAHEINNPLNFIYGNLPHIQAYCDELIVAIALYEEGQTTQINQEEIEFIQDDLPSILNSMQMGITRIQDIVKSLRTFSNLDEARCKQIDLHANINSVLVVIRHRLALLSINSAIQLEQNYGNLPSIECFPGELNQVFLHILSNAADAIQEKYADGLYNPPTPDKISITTEQIDKNTIQVAIANTGTPITPEIQEHLFEPFFSTKPVGKGTGMGLSVSYQIIHDVHKGQIWCDTNGDHHTVFYFQIPISQTA